MFKKQTCPKFTLLFVCSYIVTMPKKLALGALFSKCKGFKYMKYNIPVCHVIYKIHKYTNTQIHKDTNTQTHKHTNKKYTNIQINKYKVIERPNVCYIFIGTVWIQRKRIRIQKTTDPDPKDNGSGSNDNEYGSTDNGSDKTGLNTTKDICIVHRVNFRKFPNWRESLPIQRFSLHISVLTWAFGVKILFWQYPFESGLCILWASLCF